MILLSILIPTVKERQEMLKALLNRLGYLASQISGPFVVPDLGAMSIDGFIYNEMRLTFGEIEIIRLEDNKEAEIGRKRELLYKIASGKYSFQLDDDDDISDEFFSIIMQAIEFDKDCITYQERVRINGDQFTSDHSLQYDDWAEKINGFDYVRTPFMKSVIKTKIARSVPVPYLRFGEDHEWAKTIKTHLQTEIHIDKELYYYQHTSTPFAERYGIDR